MACLLSSLLDNTFIGTVLAGVILAFFGFWLYRKQKSTDIKYEDLRKIRELSSLLFANIDIAFKKYETQIDIYTNKHGQLQLIEAIKSEIRKNDKSFDNKIIEEFKELTNKITDSADNLIAQLKIAEHHEEDIKIITEKTNIFNFYLSTVSALNLFKPDELEEQKMAVEDALNPLRVVLQKIIKLV